MINQSPQDKNMQIKTLVLNALLTDDRTGSEVFESSKCHSRNRIHENGSSQTMLAAFRFHITVNKAEKNL